MAALVTQFTALYCLVEAETRRLQAAERLRALAISEFAELYDDDDDDDDSDEDDSDSSKGSDLVSGDTDYARDSDYFGESDCD